MIDTSCPASALPNLEALFYENYPDYPFRREKCAATAWMALLDTKAMQRSCTLSNLAMLYSLDEI